MSKDQIQKESLVSSESFQPDVYYFPIQVKSELEGIQNNFLGKILTLVEAIGLSPKQEKATKDLIRTIIKEQMIKTNERLSDRLRTLFILGMQPIDMQSSHENIFDTSYRVTSVYTEQDMLPEAIG